MSAQDPWLLFWKARAEEARFRLLTPSDGCGIDTHLRHPQPHVLSRLDASIGELGSRPRILLTWRQRRAILENALAAVHLAELELIRIQPDAVLMARLPEFAQVARECLEATDARRKALESLKNPSNSATSQNSAAGHPRDAMVFREVVYEAMRVAHAEFERRQLRLGNFAMATYVGAIVMTALALVTVVFGSLWPTLLPLCFVPTGEGQVCVTGSTPGTWDHLIVAMAGLLGAAIAASLLLRKMESARSLHVGIALLVLKLASGALTATLGILLLRANFVPGFSALDSSAQIIAWSVVFGYAQQLFTSVVDNHAQGLVESAESFTKYS